MYWTCAQCQQVAAGGSSWFATLGIPTIFLVAGYVFGTVGDAFSTRPKLKVTGAGYSSILTLEVMHVYGRMGFEFGGNRMPHIRIGPRIVRSPALDVTARLQWMEGPARSSVGLCWANYLGGAARPRSYDFNCGQRANVQLFAVHGDYPGKYWVYAPQSPDSPEAIIPPGGTGGFDASRRFTVAINYGIKILEHEIEITVRDGTVDFSELPADLRALPWERLGLPGGPFG